MSISPWTALLSRTSTESSHPIWAPVPVQALHWTIELKVEQTILKRMRQFCGILDGYRSVQNIVFIWRLAPDVTCRRGSAHPGGPGGSGGGPAAQHGFCASRVATPASLTLGRPWIAGICERQRLAQRRCALAPTTPMPNSSLLNGEAPYLWRTDRHD